ncbi:MAG: DNA polymerase III subunit gamma/tau [Chlamydiae bacterium]|nr:DNA polymerase III subunit gamma/tau [Chlamydiota bacterium]
MSIVSQQVLKNLSQSLLLIGAKKENALDLCKQILGPIHLAKIDSGNHPDLHFYVPEGKSHLHPMANIQKIVREMGFPPFEAERKIFIIEEAEKMLPSGSNALLKTLEEPSEDTYFLLLSDHPDQLLPTVLSRLQPISYSNEEIPPFDVRPYIALAQKGEWDKLLEALSNLDEEDPKTVLHGFLHAEKDPILFESLSKNILEAQKALDHNVKPRTVYLNLLLKN